MKVWHAPAQGWQCVTRDKEGWDGNGMEGMERGRGKRYVSEMFLRVYKRRRKILVNSDMLWLKYIARNRWHREYIHDAKKNGSSRQSTCRHHRSVARHFTRRRVVYLAFSYNNSSDVWVMCPCSGGAGAGGANAFEAYQASISIPIWAIMPNTFEYRFHAVSFASSAVVGEHESDSPLGNACRIQASIMLSGRARKSLIRLHRRMFPALVRAGQRNLSAATTGSPFRGASGGPLTQHLSISFTAWNILSLISTRVEWEHTSRAWRMLKRCSTKASWQQLQMLDSSSLPDRYGEWRRASLYEMISLEWSKTLPSKRTRRISRISSRDCTLRALENTCSRAWPLVRCRSFKTSVRPSSRTVRPGLPYMASPLCRQMTRSDDVDSILISMRGGGSCVLLAVEDELTLRTALATLEATSSAIRLASTAARHGSGFTPVWWARMCASGIWPIVMGYRRNFPIVLHRWTTLHHLAFIWGASLDRSHPNDMQRSRRKDQMGEHLLFRNLRGETSLVSMNSGDMNCSSESSNDFESDRSKQDGKFKRK